MARLLTGWERYVAAALLIICGFTFTPAVTCSAYSIVKEKQKMIGGVGLFIAALTVWLQRETLHFVEMGIALVPCTLVVMAVIQPQSAGQGHGAWSAMAGREVDAYAEECVQLMEAA